MHGLHVVNVQRGESEVIARLYIGQRRMVLHREPME